MQNRRRSYKTGRIPRILTGFLAVALILATAYGLATVWQKAENTGLIESDRSAFSSIENVIPVPYSPPTQSTDGTEDPTAISGHGGSPIASTTPPREGYPYALPDTGVVVEKSYFDDALFFGDSMSMGIPLYEVMPNAKVIAAQVINTISVNTDKVIALEDGNRVTMLEAASHCGEKGKIYIMFGGNSLGFERELFLDGYRDFVKSVKFQYPQSNIFLQSILPVTEYVHEKYPGVSNELINDYNTGIMELAKEMGVCYVDVAAAMVDEEGKLPAEASPSDGMHLSGPYYFKWFDYLRSHTAGN